MRRCGQSIKRPVTDAAPIEDTLIDKRFQPELEIISTYRQLESGGDLVTRSANRQNRGHGAFQASHVYRCC